MGRLFISSLSKADYQHSLMLNRTATLAVSAPTLLLKCYNAEIPAFLFISLHSSFARSDLVQGCLSTEMMIAAEGFNEEKHTLSKKSRNCDA